MSLFPRNNNDDFFGTDDPADGPPPMANFLLTLVAFFLVGSCLALLLLVLRRRRRALIQQGMLPTHRQRGHHRQLTIATSANLPPNIQVIEERQGLLNSDAKSAEPSVPEIRITFPDEEGNALNKATPRVVVVRIGDTGAVGMEPLQHEDLPPYHSDDAGRFESLDLERIGGLREKETAGQHRS